MRKVLIPTDFSENAKNAIKYACELFKHEVSEFFIMHAYQDEIYADESLLNIETLDVLTKIISEKSKTQLEDLTNYLNNILPNPKHTYHIISSNNILLNETYKIVDKENIDVIIIGTRGKRNDRSITFGSHTLQVLKYVECPVLAIPENYKYKQPKHILFATNYLIPYKQRELNLLCEMLSPFKAIIHILYISNSDTLSKKQEDNKNLIKDVLYKSKINFQTSHNRNITNAIFTYIKENSIDMLVMVNTKQSFLENILFQTTVDTMSLYLNIPFLALQNIKRDRLYVNSKIQNIEIHN